MKTYSILRNTLVPDISAFSIYGRVIRQFISFLFVILLPLSVIADEHKGYYFPMKKGTTAPYDGILLDKNATAKVLGQARLCGDDCNLKLRILDDEFKLIFQKEVDVLNIKLIQKDNTHRAQIDLKEKELTELRKIALNSGFDWTAFIMGTSIGAAVMGGVVLAVILSSK